MKNIFILSTDKPSMLFYDKVENKLIKKNICITSDEEIKVNDYITDGYLAWKWKDDSSLLGRKKVILTTDQDLIKDGVQAIDDEFLEWFVKNPSCEYIDIDKIYNDYGETDIFDLVCTPHSFKYKIIIPDEIEQQIILTKLRSEKVIKYLNNYKGQSIYNEIALAIEFGYQLKLEENE